MRSTPICALQVACKEMPLDLRHQYLSLRFKNKIMGSNNHPCRDVYSDSQEQESGRRTFFKSVHCITTSSMPQLTEIATNYPSLLLQTAPWTIEAPRIDMALDSIRRELPPTRQLLAAEYINSQFSEYEHIYTDGPKSLTGTGSSFFIPSKGISQSQSNGKFFTSYSAELKGIEMALKWALENYKGDILILTDCQSALSSVENFHNSCHHLVTNIINLLHDFRLNRQKIELMWIPSHSGIPGNEKADKIAKSATNLPAGETKQITYQEADHWLREEIKKIGTPDTGIRKQPSTIDNSSQPYSKPPAKNTYRADAKS